MLIFVVTPPSEPPIFEISPSVTVMENEPIFIHIAAYRPETGDTQGLEVYVENVPSGANFSRGRQEGDRWIFAPENFGEVELELPPDFSGRLDLEIIAVADGTSRRRSLVVAILSSDNTTGVATAGETTVTGRIPTTGETLLNTEDTPANTVETPTVTGEVPRVTGETTSTRETPGVTGATITQDTTMETPAMTEETPEITQKNTGETPAMTEETLEITQGTKAVTGTTMEENLAMTGMNFH